MGQRSGPDSRQARTAHLRWQPQFLVRQHSAASARMGSDFSDAGMRSTHSRRQGDRMLSVAGVASGGHITPHPLPTKSPRCAFCARDHLTTDHQCPVKLYRVGKGHPCPHGAAKCANCGGAHGARADACAFKREARQPARGWRLPPPPRRERRAADAPKSPETETPATQGGEGVGEAEVDSGERGPAPTVMETGE